MMTGDRPAGGSRAQLIGLPQDGGGKITAGPEAEQIDRQQVQGPGPRRG